MGCRGPGSPMDHHPCRRPEVGDHASRGSSSPRRRCAYTTPPPPRFTTPRGASTPVLQALAVSAARAARVIVTAYLGCSCGNPPCRRLDLRVHRVAILRRCARPRRTAAVSSPTATHSPPGRHRSNHRPSLTCGHAFTRMARPPAPSHVIVAVLLNRAPSPPGWPGRCPRSTHRPFPNWNRITRCRCICASGQRGRLRPGRMEKKK